MSSTDECVYVQNDNLKNMELRGVPVLDLDVTVHGDLNGSEFYLDSPVSVFEESIDGENIGAAHVYRSGSLILADIFINYSSPVRLSIETGMPVRPMVSARIRVSNGVVTGVEIDGLVLATAGVAKHDIDLSKYVSN